MSEGKVDAAPPRRLRLAEAIFHAHNFEVTAAVEERELADPFVQRGHGRKQGRGALDVDDAADVAFIIAGRLLDAALPKFRRAPSIFPASDPDDTTDDVVEVVAAALREAQ